MYSKELEELIDAALADGVLTEKEKQILLKKAKAQGIDLDEFEMVLDAKALKVQQSQSVRPAKEKKGNIITCPNCGAPVSALAGVCPECGHEFTGVKANSSAKLLAEKLEKVTPHVGKGADEDDKQASIWNQMATIVSSFPIPNAKADLFEFAVSMKTKMTIKLGGIASTSQDAGATLMAAYLNKYQESMIKIMSLYSADDPVFSNLIDHYKKDVKIAKKAIWWQGHGKNFKGVLGSVSIFVILGIFFAFAAISEEKDYAKIDAQYESLLNQIKALPVPTKNNCEECAYEIQKIDWQVQYSGSDNLAEDEMTKRKAFYERKNAYIDLLQKQGVRIEKVEIPEESKSLLDRLF